MQQIHQMWKPSKLDWENREMLYNYREELEITTMASERNIQKDYQVNLDLHILLAHSL